MNYWHKPSALNKVNIVFMRKITLVQQRLIICNCRNGRLVTSNAVYLLNNPDLSSHLTPNNDMAHSVKLLFDNRLQF
jgi:hypothetical protein